MHTPRAMCGSREMAPGKLCRGWQRDYRESPEKTNSYQGQLQGLMEILKCGVRPASPVIFFKSTLKIVSGIFYKKKARPFPQKDPSIPPFHTQEPFRHPVDFTNNVIMLNKKFSGSQFLYLIFFLSE